ncbi:MAG TPA: FHA domain-containing protein [Planctomycetaceae bacterium]|nr:FHA domain-containing protein [Planctomycetaceae bacterium]HQZ68372.1 FHA domain-containing protein [Planctomycetaceae bacterium]
MVSAELKVIGGKHAGQVILLNRRKFLIGREQDCQLRPNSEMVSRHHCVFSVDDYSVRLRDLGSTNGTLVNGERIRKDVVLVAGDKVVIGNLEFELVIRPGVTAIESDSAVVPSIVSAATPEAKADTQFTEQTLYELPAVAPNVVAADTKAPAVPIPPEAALPAALTAPAANSGDTTVLNMPQMMPGQYPYQQMMPQMGYPGGMYPGFPYQQMMPGYGQMYPQMMPQMGYPTQAPETPVAAPAAPSVVLPNPEDTGAKEKEVAKGSSGTKDAEKPTGAADAIIKQYMGRRPGG